MKVNQLFRRLVLITFLLVYAFRCVLAQESVEIRDFNGDSFLYADIDKALDGGDFDLTRVISDFEVVILDNNEEALMGKVGRIRISEDHIVIFANDIMQPLRLFRRDGEFIRTIGSVGRGPGEYRYINGLELNEQYILAETAGKKYYIYDYSGKLISEFALETTFPTISFLANDNSVISIGRFPYENRRNKPTGWKFIRQDLEGAIKYQKTLMPKSQDISAANSSILPQLYDCIGEYRLYIGRDTLFTYNADDNSFDIEAVFHSGKMAHQYEESDIQTGIMGSGGTANTKWLNSLDGKTHLQILLETNKYYVLGSVVTTISDDGWIQMVHGESFVLDKQKRILEKVELVDSQYGLEVIIKGKQVFSLTDFQNVNNQYLVKGFQAIDLKKEIKQILNRKHLEGGVKDRLIELDKKIDAENSNVILFIYTIKQ